MRLVITSDEQLDDYFIFGYLKNYIYKTGISLLDKNKLKQFDDTYNVDSYNILKTILNNLSITKTSSNQYIISPNNNLKIEDIRAEIWIRLITYGNRELKGYPVLLELFNFIADNIDDIYERWFNGY